MSTAQTTGDADTFGSIVHGLDRASRPPAPYEDAKTLRHEARNGAIAALLITAIAGGFATYAPISGAVIAGGSLVIDSNVKKIQHLAGGTVETIAVKDGDLVKAGQVLVKLDPTVARANLHVLTGQLDELAIRRARLIEEQSLAMTGTIDTQVTADYQLDAPLQKRERSQDEQNHIAASIKSETVLLRNRHAAISGKLEQYQSKITQLGEQVDALNLQRRSKTDEIALIGKELLGVTQLYEKQLVSTNRIITLQRDATKLDGERGALTAQIAEAENKISETKLAAIQIQDEWQADVLKDLRDTQSKEAELSQRAIAAEDVMLHTSITAPVAGIIQDLSPHTLGGVVQPGEVLMEIVPQDDALVVEAKVQPQEIDSVHQEQSARVKFPGLNQRIVPEIAGKVSYVGADITQEQSKLAAQPAAPYYRIRIAIPASERLKLGHVNLIPGMPAEVFVTTEERTLLQYLIKPLREQFSKTFNER